MQSKFAVLNFVSGKKILSVLFGLIDVSYESRPGSTW